MEFIKANPKYEAKDWDVIKEVAKGLLARGPEPEMTINGKINPEWAQYVMDGIDPSAGIGRASMVFKYGIENALKKIAPKMRMSGTQLKKYLANSGIAPKQIEMAGIDDTIRTGDEWLKQMTRNPGYGLDNKRIRDGFEDILLPGSNEETYGTNLSQFHRPRKVPGKDPMPPNHYGDDAYAAHARSTDEILDGRPIKMIQELQSDYAQAERQGKGLFRKNVDKDFESIMKDKIKIYNEETNPEIKELLARELDNLNIKRSDRDSIKVRDKFSGTEEQADAIYGPNRALRDLPIKPEALRRQTIIQMLDDAMKDDYARIGIPIKRSGSLAGSDAVTETYKRAVPQDFKDIQKKLGI